MGTITLIKCNDCVMAATNMGEDKVKELLIQLSEKDFAQCMASGQLDAVGKPLTALSYARRFHWRLSSTELVLEPKPTAGSAAVSLEQATMIADFNRAMRGHQYGMEEARDARGWFAAGWKAKEERVAQQAFLDAAIPVNLNVNTEPML